MSFLDRIRECNAHDLSDFLPFEVARTRVGWVRRRFAAELALHRAVFDVSGTRVTLAPGLDDPLARSRAVGAVVEDLARRGAVKGWRGEIYPVAESFGAPPLLTMERAAVPYFGVRAWGIHLNGFVRDGTGIRLWIGRRAHDKQTYPGALDNLVAGGQPVGIGLRENLVKEAAEEASIPAALVAAAVPVGAISYCQEAPEGLKPDVLFVYDLELPAEFVPRNTDGEIEEFFLWPAATVMHTVARTTEFKFNCNLVNIDFFIRHGLIPPEHPDYLEIVKGLRQ